MEKKTSQARFLSEIQCVGCGDCESNVPGALRFFVAPRTFFSHQYLYSSTSTFQADLQALLTHKPSSFRLYDGFEPSGRMHIAQGVFKAVNVNKCTAAGGTFVFWVSFSLRCASLAFTTLPCFVYS